MKPEELCIVDWVRRRWTCRDTGREVVRDFQITEIRKNGETLYAWGKNGNMGRVDQLEPIPLTTEILEKNGFYYDEDRKAYLMGVIFRVKPERYGLFSFEICGCPYPLNTVSQLQHALRLCGIEKEIEL